MNDIQIRIDISKIDRTALFTEGDDLCLMATLKPAQNSNYRTDWLIVQDLGDRRKGEGGVIGGGINQ